MTTLPTVGDARGPGANLKRAGARRRAGGPQTLQEYVAGVVSDAILAGAVKPLQRISAEALGRELGISHIPVREALKVLEGEGLLKRMPRPRRGFFVSSFSREEMEDVYYLRQLLEDDALRRSIPLLQESDLQRIRDHYEEMERALATGDTQAYIAANRGFHFVAFEKLKSGPLERFLVYLWDAAVRYYAQAGAAIDRRVLHQQHRGLLEAFEARDVERVLEITHAHRSVTLTGLAAVMPTQTTEEIAEFWPPLRPGETDAELLDEAD
jgi:DNA-binding GntR family transcriptional regulator